MSSAAAAGADEDYYVNMCMSLALHLSVWSCSKREESESEMKGRRKKNVSKLLETLNRKFANGGGGYKL